MNWWRRGEVRITHEPTGLTATSNEGRAPPSHHRMRRAALAMLRGKLFARSRGLGGPLPLVRTYVIPSGEHTTPTLETGDAIDAEARERSRALEPVVTFTVTVDRAGNITNDTQTHGSTFAEVYRAFHAIRAEVQRQIDQRRQCPFNPMHGVDPVFPDDQAPQCDVCKRPLGAGWCGACSAEADARNGERPPVTILGASGGIPE